ncbi:MAG: ABC transporter permease subunit [Clostridiales Family XIII bacterium]|jgi:NitT/TauT family transport system permease protein|nr:ABC transporter permease subunit [Clostridiales Family XIII bacterium]
MQNRKQSLAFILKIFAPALAAAVCLAVQALVPDASTQPKAKHPYFTYFMLAMVALQILLAVRALVSKRGAQKVLGRWAFRSVVFLVLTVFNYVIAKRALFPILYFPTYDRILGVLVEERAVVLKCLLYSLRLLLFGYFGGAIIGFFTGVSMGFSRKVSYWLSTPVHLVGPMPSTAWIPILLVIFPSAFSASAVLIGIAVWFPVTLMTASGISNISQTYFDVAGILGARRAQQIVRVGIPAAAPHIFLGVFNGACMSFITLVVAELIGAKYGIGWYINWQKEMLAYANVYAGLIVIAIVFSLLVTALFRLRDVALVWQKGVIKW